MMNRFFTLLFAASCLTAVGQYEVGDIGPAGGWIFYVDTDNQFEDWDYLESWQFQIGVFPVWCSGDANLTSSSLGAGKANTEQFGTEWEYSQVSAFELARVFDGGDYHDWYIPSKNEIDEIVNSGIVQNFPGGVIGNTTVSSTANSSCNWLVYNDDYGWGQSVSLGNYYILPVRQFKNMNDGQICGEGTTWDPMAQTCIVDESACGWQPDGNGDNLIGVNDLLDLLGVYGDTDYDQDGIWDSADDCVGEYDECGVCNGLGPTVPVIESIEILYDSLYAEQIDQWLVFEVGADTTFSYTCEPGEPVFQACGDPVGYQGYDYATVIIGDQCWFAENLRSENYANGDAIPSNLSDSEWSSNTSGGVTVIGEGSSTCNNYSPDGDACDDTWSLNEYGRLYNWYAVDDARGLCPSGWHIPTDEEWSVMTDHLGGSSVAGGYMKTDYGWYNDGGGANTSGFSGLPGGNRNSYGNFNAAGFSGFWWSASMVGSNAWYRYLDIYDENVNRLSGSQSSGFSIRCIQDVE